MSSQRTNTQTDRDNEKLLNVDQLSVEFKIEEGIINALRDVSLSVEKGETVGIAGESGSGKSTLALAIVQYLDDNAKIPNGSIEFQGRNLLNLSKKERMSVRGKQIAHVAQNASRALNPSMRIGEQIKEAILLHQDVSGEDEATQEMYETLRRVNIPDPQTTAKRYPSELSGGQQQRALIAIGLSCHPELLILDEPTTGLDVTTQAKLLTLIEELKAEYEMGILLITHNLSVIAQIADRVNILYAGEMMEKGPVSEVFAETANPYTQALLATTPELGKHKTLKSIPGQIPELGSIPDGCIFADRCEFATDECRTGEVPVERVSPVHESKCHHADTVRENPTQHDTAAQRTSNPGETILEAEDLVIHYDEPSVIERFLGTSQPVQALQGVDISVREGETVGLVGESGCGKSTLGRTLLGLHEPTEGTVSYRGMSLSTLSKSQYRDFRSECQIIFQDPESSLNPRKKVHQIIRRPVKKFSDRDEAEQESRVNELLEQVNLSPDLKSKYPHELSGGQQQRVSIARAFAVDPSLVVLDEPVSSLDVSVQASILNLLDSLQDEYNTAYLLISHDMGVIESVSDRLEVMYLGKTVEEGTLDEVFQPPYHPYTRSLLSSIPALQPGVGDDWAGLEGDVPSARNPPSGCSFQTRCPQKIGEVCETEEPNLQSVENGSGGDNSHCVSCHLDNEEMSEQVSNLTRAEERS